MAQRSISDLPERASKKVRQLSASDLAQLEQQDQDSPHISPLITLIFIKKILLIAAIIAIYFAMRR